MKQVNQLVKRINDPSISGDYPKSIDSNAKITLYDNLVKDEDVVLKIDEAIIKNKPDAWKGNPIKEQIVKIAIKAALKKLGINDDKKVRLALKITRGIEEY